MLRKTLHINIGDIKRLYITKGTIKVKCPECGAIITWKSAESNDHLYYPQVNKEEEIMIECDECGIYFEFPIVIKEAKVIVEVDVDNIRKSSW